METNQLRNIEKESTVARSNIDSKDCNSLSYRIAEFKNLYNPLNDLKNQFHNYELCKKNRKLASKSVNNQFISKENNQLAENSNYQIVAKPSCDPVNYFYQYKRICGKRILTLPKLSKTMKSSEIKNCELEKQKNITSIPVLYKDEIAYVQNKDQGQNINQDPNCKMINSIRECSPKISTAISSMRNNRNSKRNFFQKKYDRNRIPSCLKSMGIPDLNKKKNLNIEILDNLINECKKNEIENDSRIIEYTRRKEEAKNIKFDHTFRIIRDSDTSDIQILKDLVNYQHKLQNEESQEFFKLQNTLKEIYVDPKRLAAKLEKNKTFTSKYRAKIYNLKRNKCNMV